MGRQIPVTAATHETLASDTGTYSPSPMHTRGVLIKPGVVFVATVLAVASVAGCRASAGSPRAAQTVASSTAKATAKATPSPAARNTVITVDVDGDGRGDRVTFAWRHHRAQAPSGDVQVSVTTASGHATAIVQVAGWNSDGGALRPPYAGAPRLLPGSGHQILVGVDSGAASETYRALRWSSGRLLTVSAPDTYDGQWFVHSSAGTGQDGYYCRSDGIEKWAVAPSGRASVTTYAWATRGWHRVGQRTVHVNLETTEIGGWHCPGLRQWPGN
jgi:hypothetical protein